MSKPNLVIAFLFIIVVAFICVWFYFYNLNNPNHTSSLQSQSDSQGAAKQITSFTFTQLNPSVVGTITQENHNVSLTVPYDTDVGNLTPVIEVSDGATLQPESGKPENFNHIVVYTVTAKDGTHQDYTVSVQGAGLPVQAIVSFTLAGQTGSTVLDQKSHAISITMPNGTNVTSLIPSIQLIAGASVSPATQVPKNFASPVTYTVTTADNAQQTYMVTVKVAQVP